MFDTRFNQISERVIEPALRSVADLPPHPCGQTNLVGELVALAQFCCSNASVKLMPGQQRERLTLHLFERIMSRHGNKSVAAYYKWLAAGAKFNNAFRLNFTLRAAFKTLFLTLLDEFYDPEDDQNLLRFRLSLTLRRWVANQDEEDGVDVWGLMPVLDALSTSCAQIALQALGSAQSVSLR
ncbi:MAG: hypothetical protein ABL864_15500 [Terricaulis sp.]